MYCMRLAENTGHKTTTTTTVLWSYVRDYPGDLVPEETLTQPLSWSSNLYQLLPSTTIHSILPVQITCLAFFAQLLSMSCLVYLLVWSPPPHVPYISSPINHCLLFATHAHTFAACFAVVSILYHLFLVFLSTPYFELYILPHHYTSIWPFSSLLAEVPPHFLSWQARSHFCVPYYFAHSCYTASLS